MLKSEVKFNLHVFHCGGFFHISLQGCVMVWPVGQSGSGPIFSLLSFPAKMVCSGIAPLETRCALSYKPLVFCCLPMEDFDLIFGMMAY